jgi:hypothetical protein
MSTTPILNDQRAFGRGIVQIVVWVVPQPVPPSEHRFKYRPVYIRDGRRLVGYDNERGKGDHRHLGEMQLPYRFVDRPSLLQDFWKDVEASRRMFCESEAQGDVAALVEWTAVERGADGRLWVPWDEVDMRLPLARQAA